MNQNTATPAPPTPPRPHKKFVPARFTPVHFDGRVQYFEAHQDGPVSSTWDWDQGFRYDIERGPEDLTTEEAQELLGQLTAALDAALAAGQHIAEGLVAELRGHRERIAPAALEMPDRDIDGTLLDFEFPAQGPVETTWHPDDGFNYNIDGRLYLDPASARYLQGSLQRALQANAAHKARMDEFAARWEAGEDLEGQVEWR